MRIRPIRTALAALAAPAALVSGLAMADAVVVYDLELGERFAAKREIVAIAKEIYGPTAVYDSGQTLPKGMEGAIRAGDRMPESIATGPVPGDLEPRLPHSERGTRWVSAGEHLFELRRDDTVAMAVYSVLPRGAE